MIDFDLPWEKESQNSAYDLKAKSCTKMLRVDSCGDTQRHSFKYVQCFYLIPVMQRLSEKLTFTDQDNGYFGLSEIPTIFLLQRNELKYAKQFVTFKLWVPVSRLSSCFFLSHRLRTLNQ